MQRKSQGKKATIDGGLDEKHRAVSGEHKSLQEMSEKQAADKQNKPNIQQKPALEEAQPEQTSEEMWANRAGGLSGVPDDSTARSLRQKAVLQMQRRLGNAYVAQHLSRVGRGLVVQQQEERRSSIELAPPVTVHNRTGEQRTTIQRQEQPTSQEEFLRDLQSGVEQSGKYVEYITKGMEHWQRWNHRPPQWDAAITNLLKISRRLRSGLSTFGNVLSRTQELITWLGRLDSLANASRAANPSNPASMTAWAQALRQQVEASQPLVDIVQGWIRTAATRGSSAAGVGGAMLPIIFAYIRIGAAALESGTRVMQFGIERQRRIIEGNFREARDQRRQPPSGPSYPGNWSAEAEQRQHARTRRETIELWNRQRAEWARQQRAIREFNERLFPRRYLRRHRARIRSRILQHLRARRNWQEGTRRVLARQTPRGPSYGTYGDVFNPAEEWWGCLTRASGTFRVMTRRGPNTIDQTATSIDQRQARHEIDNFRRLSRRVPPGCPFFNEIYDRELRQHLRRAASPPARATP